MIQEVQDLKTTTEFVYHYILEELHEKQVEKDDVYEMLTYAKEDKNSYVYESYLNGKVNGVFIGGIQENTISLDDFFCTKSEIFYDLFNFFKNRFQGYTLVSYFHNRDKILKNVLENYSASVEILSYLMSYNSFLSNIKKINEEILLIKYDKKYFKVLKKLNAKTDLDLEMVYIVFKKKKSLGFVEVSFSNENDVYIEDIKLFSKYNERNLKESILYHVCNQYLDYKVNAIISYYDEEQIASYTRVGFEIEDDFTFLEATLTL